MLGVGIVAAEEVEGRRKLMGMLCRVEMGMVLVQRGANRE
jgi:hypothetical protein